MASFGKKILSAFVEVTDKDETVTGPEEIKTYSTPVVPSREQSTAVK